MPLLELRLRKLLCPSRLKNEHLSPFIAVTFNFFLQNSPESLGKCQRLLDRGNSPYACPASCHNHQGTQSSKNTKFQGSFSVLWNQVTSSSSVRKKMSTRVASKMPAYSDPRNCLFHYYLFLTFSGGWSLAQLVGWLWLTCAFAAKKVRKQNHGWRWQHWRWQEALRRRSSPGIGCSIKLGHKCTLYEVVFLFSKIATP